MGPGDQVSDEDREKAKLLRRMLEAQNKLDTQSAAKVPQGYSLVQETADGGKIYRAPDGKLSFTSSGYATNDQAEIQRMIQGAAPAAARRSETNKQIVEQGGLQAGAASAMQGIPFVGQYFDEAVGAMTGDPRATAAIRENQAAYQEQKPAEAFAGQAALGTIATLPLVPIKALAGAVQAAPTLGAKMLTGLGIGAGTGAVEGAVSGFGAGEGSAEQRLPSAGVGAATGGFLGGLFGGFAPAVETGVKNALSWWGNRPVRDMAKHFGISNDAAKVVLAAVQDNDIPTARAALQRGGSTSMLGEATQGTKNLLDAAIAMGSGTDRAQQALLARNLRGEQEMRGAFDRFLGNPEDIKDVTGNIRQASSEQRQQLYDAAYSKQIDYSTLTGKELQNWLKFVPPEAFRYANKIRSMDPNARAPQIVFTENADGTVGFGAAAAAAPGAPAGPQWYHSGTIAPGEAVDVTRGELGFHVGGKQSAEIRSRDFPSQKQTLGEYDVKGNFARVPDMGQWGADDYITARARSSAFDENLEPMWKELDALAKRNPDRKEWTAAVQDAAKRNGVSGWEYKNVQEGGGMSRIIMDPQAIAAKPKPQNSQLGEARFNVEQWDLITRGLNEMAYGSPAGSMGGKSEVQSLAAKNAREIRKIIMDQVPEYRAALGLARDTIEEVKSAEVGFNLLNGGTTIKEVKDMLSGNNPAAIQSMKLGLRSGLDHALGNLKVSAANPNTEIKELMAGLSTLRSRNNMSKVRALLGDADADEFYKVLDEQATGIELSAAVAMNSKTAQRQAVGRAVEEVTAPGILGAIQRAEPVNASKMVVQSITGKTPEADAARRMGLYDDIATLLTRVQGQRARDALNLIEQAKAGKALNDVQAAIIAKAVTTPAAIGTFKAMTNGHVAGQVRAMRPQEATYGRQATE